MRSTYTYQVCDLLYSSPSAGWWGPCTLTRCGLLYSSPSVGWRGPRTLNRCVICCAVLPQQGDEVHVHLPGVWSAVQFSLSRVMRFMYTYQVCGLLYSSPSVGWWGLMYTYQVCGLLYSSPSVGWRGPHTLTRCVVCCTVLPQQGDEVHVHLPGVWSAVQFSLSRVMRSTYTYQVCGLLYSSPSAGWRGPCTLTRCVICCTILPQQGDEVHVHLPGVWSAVQFSLSRVMRSMYTYQVCGLLYSSPSVGWWGPCTLTRCVICCTVLPQ